jgi:hypothetical protein
MFFISVPQDFLRSPRRLFEFNYYLIFPLSVDNTPEFSHDTVPEKIFAFLISLNLRINDLDAPNVEEAFVDIFIYHRIIRALTNYSKNVF